MRAVSVPCNTIAVAPALRRVRARRSGAVRQQAEFSFGGHHAACSYSSRGAKLRLPPANEHAAPTHGLGPARLAAGCKRAPGQSMCLGKFSNLLADLLQVALAPTLPVWFVRASISLI